MRADIAGLVLLLGGCGDRITGLEQDGGSPSTPDAHVERKDPVRYDWGNVIINVGDTPSTITGLTLIVTDRADPPVLDTTIEYPPASPPHGTDGARVFALHTCADPSLVQLRVSSCAGFDAGGTAPPPMPGCAEVEFRYDGQVGGRFSHPGGMTCDILSGSAVFSMPEHWPPPPPDAGSQLKAAFGTFTVNCRRPDGTALALIGSFAVPMTWRQLQC